MRKDLHLWVGCDQNKETLIRTISKENGVTTHEEKSKRTGGGGGGHEMEGKAKSRGDTNWKDKQKAGECETERKANSRQTQTGRDSKEQVKTREENAALRF